MPLANAPVDQGPGGRRRRPCAPINHSRWPSGGASRQSVDVPSSSQPPRSSAGLSPGDFWAVPLPSGRYGAGQVLDVRRDGPGSRTTFVAGVVQWVGDVPPTDSDVAGQPIGAVGLTDVALFKETDAVILGNLPIHRSAVRFDNPLRDLHAGARHSVWGWRTFVRRVAEVAGESA